MTLALAECGRVGHAEAWAMEYGYAMRLIDAAGERASAPGETGGQGPGRGDDEPVVTDDGIELPRGMSAMARMFGKVNRQG